MDCAQALAEMEGGGRQGACAVICIHFRKAVVPNLFDHEFTCIKFVLLQFGHRSYRSTLEDMLQPDQGTADFGKNSSSAVVHSNGAARSKNH